MKKHLQILIHCSFSVIAFAQINRESINRQPLFRMG